MSSMVRLKRLAADFEYIGRVFTNHPYVRVVEVEGDPPERYKIEFKLKGLVIQDAQVVTKLSHLAEVYLPLGYPRQAPQCRMLSPIYHPNIAPHAICIGDHWSAGESLAALIARIGEIITFQSYNVKSPLNGEAARWAEQNVERLPIQKVDLSVGIEGMKPAQPPPPEAFVKKVAPAPAAAPASRQPVRYPSALTATEGAFPHDVWLKSVITELKSDPVGSQLGMPMSAVVSRLKNGMVEQAIKEFDPIRMTPGVSRLPQVHFLASLIQGAQRKTDKQILALENATKVDATYAVAWHYLASAALKAGQADKSNLALEQYFRFNPPEEAVLVDDEPPAPPKPAPPPKPAVKYPSSLVSVEGGSTFPLDEWLFAVQTELRSDAVGLQIIPSLSQVALALKAGSVEGAIKAFDPIRVTPGVARLPQVHFLAALVQEAQLKTEKQLAALENATKVDATYAVAFYHLGMTAGKLGQADKATAAFERYLLINPASEAAKRWLESARGTPRPQPSFEDQP